MATMALRGLIALLQCLAACGVRSLLTNTALTISNMVDIMVLLIFKHKNELLVGVINVMMCGYLLCCNNVTQQLTQH